MSDERKKSDLSRRNFLEHTGTAALAGILGSAPFKWVQADDRANEIVRASIYPGIGIARIGNSVAHNGYFIGPEVTEPPLTRAGQSRDAAGAIKRQAARFRIYGFNAKGEVVRELTPDLRTDIQWNVHLANKKADWYRFVVAMDIPEAKKLSVPRRNADVKGSLRGGLAIDPGPRSISGRSRAGSAYRFDSGKFLGHPVSLGELRTDSQGRLLVLSGLGKSGSPEKKPPFVETDADTFNNADGWYDDIADGPVSASVSIDGREIPVESAWVAVAPPNYAPDVIGWRTLYELLIETYIAAGMMPVPKTTSFTRDILPIFKRLSGLQWVNKGFADTHGKMSKHDFEDPKILQLLADHTRPDNRLVGMELFRTSDKGSLLEKLWPMLYGDAYGTYEDTPREHFIITDLTRLHLKRWSNGEFINDYDAKSAAPPRKLSEVPLREQPEMLTRAALHFCLADAFHPGCELTWPMRHASIYRAPFRIRERAPDAAVPDFGAELTAETALSDQGPLHEQGPGELTRWMAVPWQGDTVFCRSGYEPEYDPYLSTFWPARVPNHVLSEANYHRAMNAKLPRAERIEAFKSRDHWVRFMKGSAPEQILQMVGDFSSIGIIEARPGVAGDPDFPEVMLVETLGPGARADHPEKSVPFGSGAPRHRGPQSPVEKAGWQSQKQFEEFRRIRMPRRPVPQ